jgi:hypothetical protein
MSGVSAGLVAIAKAAAHATDGSQLAAQAVPNVTLGPAHTSVALTLALAPTTRVFDAFEPDDTIAAAQHRAAITVGTTESHTLMLADVDTVLVQLTSGQKIALRAKPGPNGLDATLRILNAADGTELAHANGPSDAFQPSPVLLFTAPADGSYALVVARNDHEPNALPYDLIVAPAGN